MKRVPKPEIDYDKLFGAAGYDFDGDKLGSVVQELVDAAYEAGQRDVTEEGPARHAMLECQSQWLDMAMSADGVGRVVATAIANAFGEAADRVRPVRRRTALSDENNVQLHVLDE